MAVETATLALDGASLTLEDVLAVAYGAPGAPRVTLTDNALALVQRAADAVQRLLGDGVVAYGITTGFGAFKNRIIPADQVQQLQRNILVSHAVGVGDPYDTAMTRAIMLIRANTLARGHSGVQPATLQLLLDMLNAGVHPVIPRKGSLGASGDLAPLAHMALPLIGEGEAEVGGEVLPGAEALRPEAVAAAERFGDLVALDAGGLSILPDGLPLARLVASAFDGYLAAGGRFSRAS